MKNIFRIFYILAFAGAVFTGCDKVKDINTVNFDAAFAADLDCISAGQRSNLLFPTFSASAVIVPTEDPNVNIYLSNIQKYQIQSVKATITSMSQENVTMTSADLTIYNFQYNAAWEFQDELLTVGKTLTLGNEKGQWDTVSQILKDGQEFTVLITGEADFSGITFTIKVEIETKVTANII